ncbi:hypothetical protein F4780DRAFT_693972 [Xylariomycetidae sp. FL0641]|nr:hypothetical protein F4780DRAFT_693972 [Xylariomycetidae sp. FL0641]
MAKQRKNAPKASASPSQRPPDDDSDPPAPFQRPPAALGPLLPALDPRRVYVLHVDAQPAALKRRVFAVPLCLNLGIVALLAARAWHVAPHYYRLLLQSSLAGTANATTLVAADLAWPALARAVAARAATFLLDFLLVAVLGAWPRAFFFGTAAAADDSPVAWRWRVGFRAREVVARRSRGRLLTDDGEAGPVDDVVRDAGARERFLARVRQATDPARLRTKTGYLLVGPDWDLDWRLMRRATALVDDAAGEAAALEAFAPAVALLHDPRRGWLGVDVPALHEPGGAAAAAEDRRRRQVFAFRDALAARGHEDLFYRWVEVVQFEADRPGGFGPARQEVVARQIREMFAAHGVDFDAFWEESVGTDAALGMP